MILNKIKKNRGLFLSHFDEKSGAPKALYNILKFILTHYELEINVFVCQPKTIGFFENLKNEQYSKGLISIEYLKSTRSYRPFLVKKLANLLKPIFTKIQSKKTINRYNKNYDFIFFNSVSYNFHKTELDEILIPKYLYLHEGSNFLNESFLNNYSFFNKFDHIFVPSKQVEKNLIINGVTKSKISILQLFLNQDEIIDDFNASRTAKKENLVVGNLAHLRAGKGIEYFLGTAKLYKERFPNDKIIFKWKGGFAEANLFKLSISEIQNGGLEGIVLLDEYTEETTDFFTSIDVLMMTSKQETFGYVVLEAANNYIPSIAFNEVIGASEFIKDYGGFVADYLSINQLVNCLKKYYDDVNLLDSHGIAANKLLKSSYNLNDKLVNELKIKLALFLN